jgi:hypothetical protein
MPQRGKLPDGGRAEENPYLCQSKFTEIAMTTADFTAPATGRSAPLFGALARKIDGSTAILLTLIVVLAIWGGAIALFGVPALYLPAVVASPVVIALLVWITFG